MRRRAFVRAGVVATTVGLAGCADLTGGGSGSGSFETVANWLPAPSEADDELDHYPVQVRSPSRLDDVSDDLVWDVLQEPALEFGNPNPDDIEYYVEADVSGTKDQRFVLTIGSFETEWIESVLEENDYTRSMNDEEFTLYVSGGTCFAVGETAVVKAVHSTGFNETPDPEPLARLLVDTKRGEVDRYTAVNEHMGALASQLSVTHYARTETFERIVEGEPAAGEFRNNVATGRSYEVSGASTSVDRHFVFLDEADVDESDFEDYIDESGAFTHYRSRPEISTSGPVVTVSGTVPTTATPLWQG